ALIKTRLTGVDKAEAGDRLAELYLMNRQPQQALTALNSTNLPNLPPDLLARRTQRRAQASAALGEARTALAELAGDTSQKASRLRASIAWQAQDWQSATNALLALMPARPKDGAAKLAEEDSEMLVNLAIAATLADRPEVLKNLRIDWTASMDKTVHAKSFQALTSGASGEDKRTMATRLAESTNLQQIVRELGKEKDAKDAKDGADAKANPADKAGDKKPEPTPTTPNPAPAP
ncbi:MAG: hypothetical protein INF41_05090, partial [Rhodospirillaceae bacterium]|nr:hypothetical protein [Rhodospirillaceae bacterium]